MKTNKLSLIKLGYGTYGMRELEVTNILERLKNIGYESLEITVSSGWPTTPQALSKKDRKDLSQKIRDLGFTPSPVMALLNLCVEGDERMTMLEDFRAACELAQDLNWGDEHAVVTSTLGKPQLAWDTGRDQITEMLVELADIAQRQKVVLAVEPHVGAALDSPEKAVWLMKKTDHPHLRLNFDISHFHVQGMDTQQCISQCMPYAVHIHIKDGYKTQDGSVVFQLPGEGNFDFAVSIEVSQLGNAGSFSLHVEGVQQGAVVIVDQDGGLFRVFGLPCSKNRLQATVAIEVGHGSIVAVPGADRCIPLHLSRV